MATGYTAKLYEGEQTFEDFVWGVARGFGALMSMRDAPADAPIPERFEPWDYHERKLEEIRAKLDELRTMSDAAVSDRMIEERVAAQRYRDEYIEKREALKVRYRRMLEQAAAFEPPTPDHQGLKETMVEQLERSIEFDCGSGYIPEVPAEVPVRDWREQQEAKLLKEIEYHRAEHAKEVERAAERTAWVQALRDALASAPSPSTGASQETGSC